MRGSLLVGVLVVVGLGLSGCCVSPPSREPELVPPLAPRVVKKPVIEEAEAPRPPAPKVDVTVPPPAPPRPPAPPVPPKVAKAIEDLSTVHPGLFVFDRETGRLRFNADITFDSGSAVVKPDARAALMKLAQILNTPEAGNRGMTIVGHTDTDAVKKAETIANLKRLGKTADNMGLSQARAEAVEAVLRTGGTDPGRMVTQGKGQTAPIAENRTAAGKAKNRRVEIYLAPGAAAATTIVVPSGEEK